MAVEQHDRVFRPAPMPSFLVREMHASGRRVRLDTGQYFLRCGQDVSEFAILESGSMRIFTRGFNGREITLYTVGPGECCLINVMCLMAGTRCPATARTEEPVVATVFAARSFLSWLDQRADFRAYIFGLVARRVGSMMSLVEEVAFQRLECRLAGYLCQRAPGGGQIATTHDAIASELGTAREVVSRLLKGFERQGVVALARASVSVVNPARLRDMAAE